MTDGPLMALDSAGLWFRAFHSVPEKLTGPHGRPVNAVRGFCDMTAALIEEYRPARVLFAMDRDWRPAWRVAAVPGYKAHRLGTDGAEDAPASLGEQVEVIAEVLDAAGACRVAAGRAEADDVLAALAALAAGAECEVVVVTGDRDLFQLADAHTRILYIGAGMKKRQLFDAAAVAERVGLDPAADARACAEVAVLVGDASDGLPGVPGIGPRTAADLIGAHGSLEGVLAAAEDPDGGIGAKRRAALLAARESLRAALSIVDLRAGAEHVGTLEYTGDPQGRLRPADADRLDDLARTHGLARPLDRLLAALGVVDHT